MNLVGATIGGLNCINGQFINPNGLALSVGVLTVEQSVFLSGGFRAEGEVRLRGTTIGGQLSCINGQFINPNGLALDAGSLTVEQGIYLNGGFRAEGEVNLRGATIGRMVWHGIAAPDAVTLDLRGTTVGVLQDETESWPVSLLLDGFVYSRIEDGAPIDIESRIDWLRRQPEQPFHPQPYVQLASVLRNSGHNAEAEGILIAKEEERLRVTNVPWYEWLWFKGLKWTIGYGHKPERAIAYVAGMLILGAWFFGVGYKKNLMVATQDNSEQVAQFNQLIFSLDAFIPLVNLHQEPYWLPSPNCGNPFLGIKSGAWLRFYLWFHIAAGWVLTTLLVVGLTGMVKG